MLEAEKNFLNSLPKNEPSAKITGTDARQIGQIYYKYFGSTDLSKLQQKEGTWDGGERVKTMEAQRMILEDLLKFQSGEDVDMGLLLTSLQNSTLTRLRLLGYCFKTTISEPVKQIGLEFNTAMPQ